MQPSVSVIKQAWLRVVLFLIAYLFLIYSGTTLIEVITAILFSETDTLNLFYTGILSVFLASFMLVFVFRKIVDRQSISSLGFAWKGFGKERTGGFLAGILLITVIATILWLMKLVQWFTVDADAQGLLIVLGLLLLVAIGEEFVFRGYVLNNLMQSMPKEAALFVSAGLFAVFHSLNPNFNLVAFINIFIAGVLLGINYIYTKKLWFGMFFHFSWNFFQGPVLGFQVSGIELPALLQQDLRGSVLLTGGGFGLEASWLATFAMSITAIILYFIFQKKYSTIPVESFL
jgi:hypothetical protein